MDILVYALAAVSVFSIYYLAKLRIDLENLRQALVLVVKVEEQGDARLDTIEAYLDSRRLEALKRLDELDER